MSTEPNPRRPGGTSPMGRANRGSDQAASVEPGGLQRLVRDIRTVESVLGDGVKQVCDSELPVLTTPRRAVVAS